MAIDRRVARIRTALYDALVALIRRKDYQEITVEDILRDADVGRSTFYAHFTGKDDLLERSLDRLKALLLAVQDDAERRDGRPGAPASVSRALFEHVAEYADVQVALAGGRGGAIVDDAIASVLADILRASLEMDALKEMPRDLVISHIVTTFSNTIRWSQRQGKNAPTPAEAERLYRKLLLEGVPAAACTAFLGSDHA